MSEEITFEKEGHNVFFIKEGIETPCQFCGKPLNTHEFHFCSGMQTFSSVPQDERIANALTRIANALEKLCQK